MVMRYLDRDKACQLTTGSRRINQHRYCSINRITGLPELTCNMAVN